MTCEAILEIIRLGLLLANTMAEGMTTEQKQQLWADHFARQAKWEGLLEKLKPVNS